jgi:hypothetical protein
MELDGTIGETIVSLLEELQDVRDQDIIDPLTAKYFSQRLWSDVHPFETIRVVSSKTIEIREMYAMSVTGSEGFFFISNPGNPVLRIRLRKDGTWRDSGEVRYAPENKPVKYHDRSF